jgi:HK97 family phage major capsid protein
MNATRQHLEAMLVSRLRETESLSAALTAAQAPEISLTRVMRGLHSGRLDGAEKEISDEMARRAGASLPLGAAYIPWTALCTTRNLTAALAPGGGYLVGADTRPVIAALRPWSISENAGITILDNLKNDQTLPAENAVVVGGWVAPEDMGATAHTPLFGQRAFKPKNLIALVRFSHLFYRQADPDAWVKRYLAQKVGELIDVAVLNGSGASGEPLGVLNTPGIGTQAGGSLAHAGTLAMKRQAAVVNVSESTAAFIAPPQVRELLEGRERAAGNGFMWENDRVASKPAFATTVMPLQTMVYGEWAEAVLGLWGEGFQVEISHNVPADFPAGIINARITVSADVALLHAGAFTKATSIT